MVQRRVLTRRKRKKNQITCWCDGYWFPHRKTGGWCNHNPNSYEFAKQRDFIRCHDATKKSIP